MKKGFNKALGFMVGCALIYASPHFMHAPMIMLHFNVIGMRRVGSIFAYLQCPVPVLLGLYVFFIGVVLVWKCWRVLKIQ